jgi:hypothetical protein
LAFIQLVFLSICGLLVSTAVAQASPSQSPPLLVEGPDGFTYTLVRDADGNPVTTLPPALDPLYEGEKRVFDPLASKWRILRVGESWSGLQEQLERASHKPVSQSDWVPESAELRISSETIEQVFKDFEQDPKKFRAWFKATAGTKVEALESLLFGSALVLTQADLEALQRTAYNPKPAPIVVSFPTETKPNGEPFIWPLQVTTEGHTDITIDHLELLIRNKQILFDHENNRMGITLICDRIEMRGATETVWRVKGLHRLMGNLIEPKNYLDSGIVDDLEVTLFLSFQETLPGYWQVVLDREIEIKPLNPKNKLNSDGSLQLDKDGQPLKVVPVKMVYRDAIKDGKGGVTNQQTIEITPRTLSRINGVLSDTLRGAFESVIPSESLGRRFQLPDVWSIEQTSDVYADYKLESFEI